LNQEIEQRKQAAIRAVQNYARVCAKHDKMPPVIRGRGSVMEDFVYKAFAYEVYLNTPSTAMYGNGKGGMRETGRRLKVDYAGLSRHFKKMGLEL
jgi:hypothetical protein